MKLSTREEMLLARLAGDSDVVAPAPRTRKEILLAYLDGCYQCDVSELPLPRTREEMYLHSMCCNGTVIGGGSDEEWFNDGDTHIWITLTKGRTSPMLGVCPKGTVTVDWGDGTTPDTLTGTSTTTVKWTPTHNYAEPGNYVITLSVDGEMGFYGSISNNQYSGILRYSTSSNGINATYLCAVKRVEIGKGITSIGDYAFHSCRSLASVVIPECVTSIGNYAFSNCYSLANVVIPEGVTSLGAFAFQSCNSLASVVIPEGVTSLGKNTFASCYSFTSVIVPKGVTYIGDQSFAACYGVRYYDFINHAAVPTLADKATFNYISDDCEIRVPASLYDEWIAATNWSTYASKIVAV